MYFDLTGKDAHTLLGVLDLVFGGRELNLAMVTVHGWLGAKNVTMLLCCAALLLTQSASLQAAAKTSRRQISVTKTAPSTTL